MVSLWAPRLPEVHTKHRHKANGRTATQCHIRTATGFKCQTHLNMIAYPPHGGMLIGDLLQLPERRTLNVEAEQLGLLGLVD